MGDQASAPPSAPTTPAFRRWSPASLTITLPIAAVLGAATAALIALFAAATEQTSWFAKPSPDPTYSRLTIVQRPTETAPGWVVASEVSSSRMIEKAKFTLYPLLTHVPGEIGGFVEYRPGGGYVDAVNPRNPKVPSFGVFLSVAPRESNATVYMHRYGWPFQSFEWRGLDFPSQQNSRTGTVELPAFKGLNAKPQPLPLFPHWPGLIRCIALYGSCWFGLLHLPAIFRHFSRRARGQCMACGYTLRGLQTLSCPECGTSHSAQRVATS